MQDKLLNRLASGAEQALGERIIKEHQINKEVLEETIQKYNADACIHNTFITWFKYIEAKYINSKFFNKSYK